ncbi:hypothetical protein DFJ74DRAFT_711734 [Hyaloraphidium curvatum]|nr:hypothetical protein DFJ74DRAFT_711734 [Hyaloraphidium curvatum]
MAHVSPAEEGAIRRASGRVPRDLAALSLGQRDALEPLAALELIAPSTADTGGPRTTVIALPPRNAAEQSRTDNLLAASAAVAMCRNPSCPTQATRHDNLHLRAAGAAGQAWLGAEAPEASQKLKACSRCHGAFYCGPECQKADWDAHKAQCKAASKAREESGTAMGKMKVDAQIKAFSTAATAIVQMGAGALISLAWAWRAPNAKLPSCLVVEIDSDDDDFKAPLAWRANPWHPVLEDAAGDDPARGPDLDKLLGRCLAVHAWLHSQRVSLPYLAELAGPGERRFRDQLHAGTTVYVAAVAAGRRDPSFLKPMFLQNGHTAERLASAFGPTARLTAHEKEALAILRGSIGLCVEPARGKAEKEIRPRVPGPGPGAMAHARTAHAVGAAMLTGRFEAQAEAALAAQQALSGLGKPPERPVWAFLVVPRP